VGYGSHPVRTSKGFLRSSVFCNCAGQMKSFYVDQTPDLNKAAAGWFLSGIAVLALVSFKESIFHIDKNTCMVFSILKHARREKSHWP